MLASLHCFMPLRECDSQTSLALRRSAGSMQTVVRSWYFRGSWSCEVVCRGGILDPRRGTYRSLSCHFCRRNLRLGSGGRPDRQRGRALELLTLEVQFFFWKFRARRSGHQQWHLRDGTRPPRPNIGKPLGRVSRAGRVLIVQIGRYINGAKDTSRVDLASEVLVPEFDEGVAVRWQAYMIKAVILPGPHRDIAVLFYETENGGATQMMGCVQGS